MRDGRQDKASRNDTSSITMFEYKILGMAGGRKVSCTRPSRTTAESQVQRTLARRDQVQIVEDGPFKLIHDCQRKARLQQSLLEAAKTLWKMQFIDNIGRRCWRTRWIFHRAAANHDDAHD
ncbi:hypothetical protein IF1G_07255 [Cordyceps javanica]|uniref:Uncharacterized protein n=1 Tax=Cordyceps javanica TaxID=43265 RepID=A0A545VX36_9HYPO|nr:hypothetical protein IF1G_07255 [Cordyceps javanica]TQW06245.1 hypothetical protein IF2G_06528 [Cordyceps javanica]